MNDLNYFPLDLESNIYGLTVLEFEDGSTKALVATTDCKINCINYHEFKPHSREVEFTYIPSGAKIISIGSLRRRLDDFAIGITHSLAPNNQKNSSKSSSSLSGREHVTDRLTTYYLNIYASGSASSKFDLDYVAQGCQTIRLRYVPYHLYGTSLISIVDKDNLTTEERPLWLLSGGDNSIHAFCEDKPYQSFDELSMVDSFPELQNIGGLAIWIDVLNFTGDSGWFERAVALGLEDGSVKLYHSVLSKSSFSYELIKAASFDDYTTVVPSVRLFRVLSKSSSKLKEAIRRVDLSSERPTRNSLNAINLLAVSSTNPSLLFMDVIGNGLERRVELPGSQRLDCCVTSEIDDIDYDGLNEIIIGSHGRELIIYKYDNSRDIYTLSEVSELNNPVYNISAVHLSGDCIKEIVILMASGVLVRQVNVQDALKTCRQRVDSILASLNIKLENQQISPPSETAPK